MAISGYGINMNFDNEFVLFKMDNPQKVFSLVRGYWDGHGEKRGGSLYTLDDEGFRIAIFQRAFILKCAYSKGLMSRCVYNGAIKERSNFHTRYLTDFNFIYYSDEMKCYFISMNQIDIQLPSNEIDAYMKECDDIFDMLSAHHNFPSIIKAAVELHDENPDEANEIWWETLYDHDWVL